MPVQLRMTEQSKHILISLTEPKESDMYYIYILTNKNNTVLYTGITNDLKRRIYEHKAELNPGFTKRYKAHKLLYFEEYTDVDRAISREKQLKGWIRARKIDLIKTTNPTFEDLGEKL